MTEMIMSDAPARFLTDRQVAELISVHRSTVWDMVNSGKLPKPVKISDRLVRWSGLELQKWHEDLIASKETA